MHLAGFPTKLICDMPKGVKTYRVYPAATGSLDKAVRIVYQQLQNESCSLMAPLGAQ
jgi:hypothetical protein